MVDKLDMNLAIRRANGVYQCDLEEINYFVASVSQLRQNRWLLDLQFLCIIIKFIVLCAIRYTVLCAVIRFTVLCAIIRIAVLCALLCGILAVVVFCRFLHYFVLPLSCCLLLLLLFCV